MASSAPYNGAFFATSCPMEAGTPAGADTSPVHTQTSMETSLPYSKCFMEAPEALTEHSEYMEPPISAALPQICLETFTPDAYGIVDSLPHDASMGNLEEIPCHEGLMDSSAMLNEADLSANCASPRTHKSSLTRTLIEKRRKKKRKLLMCGNGFPSSQNGNSSSWEAKFSKCRQGLFKKAQELSVLCSVEVGAIIFSPSGEVSEFASSSMSNILKRYQSFQPQMPSHNVLLQDIKRCKKKAILQNDGINDLKDFESMSLSINEAQVFESILATSLEKIRTRKMQLLEVETQKIIEKGELLGEEKTILNEKLIEVMLTKEYISNSLSGWEKLYCFQDDRNTNLQHRSDISLCNQEENSYSSKN